MRFYIFKDLSPLMTDAEYWHYLAFCHTGTDNGYNLREHKKTAFSSTRPCRHMLMEPSERKFLKNLPETFTIYRGMTRVEYESGDFGISWTLSQEQGHFFAHTYIRNQDTEHMPKVVARATVKKSAVIAYFEGSEQEIIVVPRDSADLTDVGVVEGIILD